MRVSLVVPALNEVRSLPNLLKDIRSQSRQADEVIIVDGGSSDGSLDVLHTAAAEWPRLRVVRAAGAHPGTARNVGAKEATGDVLAFTDAGTRLDPRWLEELTSPFEESPDVELVYGSYEPIVSNPLQAAAAHVYVPPLDLTFDPPMRHHSVASLALRPALFEQAGRFPHYRAAEDRIFMERVDRIGPVTEFSPRAIVHWEIPETSRATFVRFRVLSRHDLRAGRAADWHFRVTRYWIVGVLLLPLLPFGLLLRVIRNIKRRARQPSWRIGHIARCLWVTVLTDAGMFAGAWDFLWKDRRLKDAS